MVRWVLSSDPGIDDLDAAAIEISDVSRCDGRARRPSNRRDLRVEVRDRSPRTPAADRDLRVGPCGPAVEGKQASGEVLLEHRLGQRCDGLAAPARGQKQDTVQDLCLGDGGRVKDRGGVPRDPASHCLGRRRTHQLRQHVRVEHDHRRGFGGSRMGSRDGSSISTPPTRRNRARTASARFVGVDASASRAAFRILRASSSIERWCCAARTRNRALVSASRLRIVMLAMPSMIALQSLVGKRGSVGPVSEKPRAAGCARHQVGTWCHPGPECCPGHGLPALGGRQRLAAGRCPPAANLGGAHLVPTAASPWRPASSRWAAS